MKKPDIDIDEIQKAMEDTDRDAFDYFLDLETYEIIILSEDIIKMAQDMLSHIYDDDISEFEDIEMDETPEIPEWMEDEIELAVSVLINEQNQYVRIPERDPKDTFSAMQEFIKTLESGELKQLLQKIVDGPGAFRKFKDALGPYPRERKLWYGFNAKKAKQNIETWLESEACNLNNPWKS